jgi:hypothetical protein
VAVRRPKDRSGGPDGGFQVFVEGPSDRDILAAWARRISLHLSRALRRSSVILGGRQPARAARHLRELRETEPEARGLCVLDGDRGAPPEPVEEPGLAYFTWSRRHIESYLLVPEAIRRSLRLRDGDGRVARLLRNHLPDHADEAALRTIDAKRLLDRNGPLVRGLPRPVAAGRIARAMQLEDFHPEIHSLLGEIQAGLSLNEPETVVALRPGTASSSPGGRGMLP